MRDRSGDPVAVREASASSESQRRGAEGQPPSSDTGTAATDGLADELGALARSLEPYSDPADALAAIVQAAVEMIPGAEDGSITIVTGRRSVRSEVPTSELPRLVDAIQETTRQGPCLQTIYHQQTVRVTDMANEDRWPVFAAQAAAAGAASMLSLQLFVRQDNLGALNLLSRRSNAFGDESEHVGLLFAAHAALAYAATSTEQQLRRAVDSRDLIGQAKGVLMERYQIDADAAFRVLIRYSQTTHRKLAAVAEGLLDERTLTADADTRSD